MARGWSSRSRRAGVEGFAPGRGARSLGAADYFQERVEGLALAALFVGEGGKARSLGLTRQFVGRPGNRFAYRGSLGPWPVDPQVASRIEALGRVLVEEFGLVGLFGIDLILAEGRPWPVEVNPRYPASVEVLEWATGTSLLAEHLRACGREAPGGRPTNPHGFVGKAIVHADRLISWPISEKAIMREPAQFPEIADVPRPGTTFQPGEPVLTVFARGETLEACRRDLGEKVRGWCRRLRPGC